eukprot:678316-Amphidinium_carterae.1
MAWIRARMQIGPKAGLTVLVVSAAHRAAPCEEENVEETGPGLSKNNRKNKENKRTIDTAYQASLRLTVCSQARWMIQRDKTAYKVICACQAPCKLSQWSNTTTDLSPRMAACAVQVWS